MGIFEDIGSGVGGVVGGVSNGVAQGLPGAIQGGIRGGATGQVVGAGIGAGVGAVGGFGVGDVLTIPGGAAAGAGIGRTVGSAGGAALGIIPGFSKGYPEGVGPGAAIGGGYGAGLDQTWLGKKLNNLIHGHKEADNKTDGNQGKCGNNCSASTPADVLKGAKKDPQKPKLKDGTDQYVKDNTNGMPDAQKDFNSLNPQNVKTDKNGTSVGNLSDGTQVVVRPKSVPSLEINPPTGTPVVIRYK